MRCRASSALLLHSVEIGFPLLPTIFGSRRDQGIIREDGHVGACSEFDGTLTDQEIGRDTAKAEQMGAAIQKYASQRDGILDLCVVSVEEGR